MMQHAHKTSPVKLQCWSQERCAGAAISFQLHVHLGGLQSFFQVSASSCDLSLSEHTLLILYLWSKLEHMGRQGSCLLSQMQAVLPCDEAEPNCSHLPVTVCIMSCLHGATGKSHLPLLTLPKGICEHSVQCAEPRMYQLLLSLEPLR